MPSLHIKLRLIKNFVKAMDQTGPAFRYLAEKFQESVLQKSRRVFSSVHRSASSSEMSSSTEFAVVTRRG
jgi:hypothetical protein